MGELFYSMAEGIMESSKEEWAITLTQEVPTWINQHDFLSCFINFVCILFGFYAIQLYNFLAQQTSAISRNQQGILQWNRKSA